MPHLIRAAPGYKRRSKKKGPPSRASCDILFPRRNQKIYFCDLCMSHLIRAAPGYKRRSEKGPPRASCDILFPKRTQKIMYFLMHFQNCKRDVISWNEYEKKTLTIRMKCFGSVVFINYVGRGLFGCCTSIEQRMLTC